MRGEMPVLACSSEVSYTPAAHQIKQPRPHSPVNPCASLSSAAWASILATHSACRVASPLNVASISAMRT